ncbi:hypothetical protein EDB84DRAFT_1230582, partial [Lactarius hengduanensis]
TEFSRVGLLEAVTKHLICDDQALMLPRKLTFRNCLVVMRPKTRSADLPSCHDVRVYLKNTFIQHVKLL